MNKHLALVKAFHEKFHFPHATPAVPGHMSDMDKILHQALLMEGGSETLRAIKNGDMAEILAGLVDLAYYALGAIAVAGGDVIAQPVTWRHDGSVVSIMRLLSDKINRCGSGEMAAYSDVYNVCLHLAAAFLNADFDKAIQAVHRQHMTCAASERQPSYDGKTATRKADDYQTPDLSDCLYE